MLPSSWEGHWQHVALARSIVRIDAVREFMRGQATPEEVEQRRQLLAELNAFLEARGFEPLDDLWAKANSTMAKKRDDMREQVQKLTEAADEFRQRFDGVDKRLDRVDERLDRVDERLDRIDERLDRVDGRLDRVDGRLDRVDGRLDDLAGMEQRMLSEFKAQGERLEERLLNAFKMEREKMSDDLQKATEGFVGSIERIDRTLDEIKRDWHGKWQLHDEALKNHAGRIGALERRKG